MSRSIHGNSKLAREAKEAGFVVVKNTPKGDVYQKGALSFVLPAKSRPRSGVEANIHRIIRKGGEQS